MKIRKVLVTAANPRQRTLPLQTLIDPAGEPKSALQVVLEEADESEFWLDVLDYRRAGNASAVKRLRQEAAELRAILAASGSR